LAAAIGAEPRTLRRAVSDGLVRCRRPSPRRLEIDDRERAYLARQWPLLAALRSALRNEPRVRLAVLFGSTARGDDRADSDVDVLVAVSGERPSGTELARRLGRATGERPVDVLLLDDAQRSPAALADVVREGRVLIDRDGLWATLTHRRHEILAAARTADDRIVADMETTLRELIAGA
jgi:predicted nucleotidyltransferase